MEQIKGEREIKKSKMLRMYSVRIGFGEGILNFLINDRDQETKLF